MSLDKKITFSGVDNFSSTFQKFNQEQKKVYSTLVEEARKQAGSSKDQLAFMQQYVRELEKAEKIEKRRQDIQNKFEYQKSMRGAKNAEERSNISNKYQANQAEGQIAGLDFSELVNNLKTLAEESKKQTKAQEDQRKTQGEKEESRLSLWAQEVKDNKKGVEANIAAAKASKLGKLFGGKDYDNVSEERKDKLRYQEQLLHSSPEEKKPESIFGAILKAELVKGIVSAIGNGLKSAAGAGDENDLIKSALSSIPGIGGVAAAIKGRQLDEEKRRDINVSGLTSSTGNNGFSAIPLGLATYQTAEIAKQVAISYGSSNDLENKTLGSLAAEKAYGLDRGVVNQQNQNARITGIDSIKNIATVVATLQGRGEFKGGDYSKLSEILQQQASFIQNQSKILERPNANAATGIMAAIRSVGGSFGDARSGERISTINSALSNPSNDFQKARNFGILNKLKPGASYFELQEMQEKGLEQKGFLGETLKQLQKETGGGEGLMIAAKQRLGLSHTQTRQFIGAFEKNNNIFDNSDIAGANKIAGVQGDINQRGERFTPEVVKTAADLSESFANGSLDGVKKAFELSIGKWSSEVISFIEEAFADAPLPDKNKIKKNQTHNATGGW